MNTHSLGAEATPESQAFTPSSAPVSTPTSAPQAQAPVAAPIQATPLHAVRSAPPVQTPASVATPPRTVAPVAQTPAATAVATAPSSALDPLTQREPSALQIDVKRDQVTSSLNANATSVNGEMILKQGIQIAGTHYGLNIISLAGVVVIPKGARILPSADRPSRIIAEKVIIAGEAIIERLQADELLLLAPDAQAVIGEIIYGKSLVTHDGAKVRITKGARPLTARERRVGHWYEVATAEHLPPEQSGYEAFCRRQDAEVEAAMSESLVDANTRHPDQHR